MQAPQRHRRAILSEILGHKGAKRCAPHPPTVCAPPCGPRTAFSRAFARMTAYDPPDSLFYLVSGLSCATIFEFGHGLGLYSHLLSELRAWVAGCRRAVAFSRRAGDARAIPSQSRHAE